MLKPNYMTKKEAYIPTQSQEEKERQRIEELYKQKEEEVLGYQ